MIGKIILYILGALLIISGIGGLVGGFATTSDYEYVRTSRIGFGFIFSVIGSILIWGANKIKTKND